MQGIVPRWDSSTFDNLKLEYMRRAWGNAPPDFVTYDVTGAPIATLKNAAMDIETMLFGSNAPPPYGSISVTYWVKPERADLVLTVRLPRVVPPFISIDPERQFRLVGYGKNVKPDNPMVVGIDNVTVHTVNFKSIWAQPGEQPVLDGRAIVQRFVTISSLPEPPQ